MSSVVNVSRRQFLGQLGLAGGAFVLGVTFPATAISSASKPEPDLNQLGYFVSISRDGKVQIVCHRSEMGQGIMTSVPQIIADELEADWERVSVVLSKADSNYGNQSTGGSASIRKYFQHIRQMGAVARDMLEQAAANRWQIDKSLVFAENHSVKNRKTGESFGYGELVQSAAALPLPEVSALRLKKPEKFKLIGKDVKQVGHREIVTGTAMYAQDVQLPDMLIASIQRPPVVGGKIKSFDDKEAKKIPGVVAVVQLKDRGLPVDVKPVSGVAVVATNSWAALEGRKKLKIEWELGGNQNHDSDSYKKTLVETVKNKGVAVRSKGNVYEHTYDRQRTLEAVYTMPYHHHMSMETPSATAVIEKNGVCRVWSGTQTPQWAKNLIIAELGYDPEKDADKVEVNVTLMGGAFGRKGKNDFTLEAVELARATGKPVKVIWSREDDVKHGFYHSSSANYFKAELTNHGSADYWVQRVAHPPINWTFDGESEMPADFLLAQGFADVPFEIDNFAAEKHKTSTHLRIGWFRAVQNLHNWFALGCFVDELADKAGVSTAQMWFNLLGKQDRVVDPRKDGFTAWNNYDQSSESYAVSTRRMKNVLQTLLEKADPDQKMPKNEGWGIGFSNSFNSYSAAATRVRMEGAKVIPLEMHTVIDCGLVITPDRVRSQMEGAMIMGLSMALSSAITVKGGEIEQSNFNDYVVSRMPEVPPLHVHIIASTDAPGGVGEPGLPPVIPSIVNAVFHASGQRVRDLPLSSGLS